MFQVAAADNHTKDSDRPRAQSHPQGKVSGGIKTAEADGGQWDGYYQSLDQDPPASPDPRFSPVQEDIL